MKLTTDGSTPRGAKTSSSQANIIAQLFPEKVAQRMGARVHREPGRFELTIKVDAATYGRLAEASLINGCTIAQAAETLMQETDALCKWRNDGYPVD